MVEILRGCQDSERKLERSYSLWWNMVFIIICKTPKITTYCRQVIRLRGMGHAIILIEKNALLCEICKGGLGREVSN